MTDTQALVAHDDVRDEEGRLDGYAPIARVAPLVLRPSPVPDAMNGYWRNVHGPELAAMPGLARYYQQHLAQDDGTNWPALPGVDGSIAPAHQLDGFAELGFADEAAEMRFDAAVDAAGVKDDDQHFVARGTVQTSLAGNNTTFVNAVCDLVPNGPVGHHAVVVALQISGGTSRADFRVCLHEHVAKAFAAHELTKKVRLVLCEDYVQEEWDAPNVDHPPVAEQYQAFLELAFADRLAMDRFYRTDAFREAVSGFGDVVRTAHAFRVRETRCMVQRGRRSLAGIYGADAARNITDIGASIRWRPDVAV